MNHRHLQIFFEQMNDVETTPAGAEHIDAIGAGIFEESSARVRVDFRRRQAADVGKRYFHSFHGENVESRFLKIAGEHIVDTAGEISDADESFDTERAQRFDLGLRRRDDRDFEFRLPILDDFFLALENVHHERRRAFRVNQIDAFLGELVDLFVHSV